MAAVLSLLLRHCFGTVFHNMLGMQIPYEIFEPDRDGIQPDTGGNTVLGVKHQPDMNLTKKCLALCWRAGQVSGLCPAEVWPAGTPTRA